MTQSHRLITYFQSRALLLSVYFFVISFGFAFAVTTAPGVVPHQAPLQPVPQGTAPNISNNIVQTPESGVPDSASTIERGTSPSDQTSDMAPDGSVSSVTSVTLEHSSAPLRYLFIAVTVVGILLAFGVYRWRQRSSEHSS